MRVATLDLGSNTFLLLLAEINQQKIISVYLDECRVTRLGQGLARNHVFSPEALERASHCFQDYSQKIKQFNPQWIRAVATSAARDSKNKEAFIEMGRQYGINIEIISGEEEAYLSFIGGINGIVDSAQCRVIDVGGGSTEFIIGDARGVQIAKSLDIGSVRLTEKFFTHHPVSQAEQNLLNSFVQSFLQSLPEKLTQTTGPVIAVAGTPTTLASLIIGSREFAAPQIHGFTLHLSDLEFWIEKLAGMSIAERSLLPGMEPLRADVIVAGSMILLESMKFLKVKELVVSTKGIRYGLAMQANGMN